MMRVWTVWSDWTPNVGKQGCYFLETRNWLTLILRSSIAQDVSLFGAKFGQPTLLPPCHGACDNVVWEAVGRWCLAWLSFVLCTLYRRCCKGGVWVSLYSVLCSLFGRCCKGGVWVSWLQPEPIIWRAVC